MSGHYATLLRGTVEAMLPHMDVYITDWVDARDVPISSGTFDLDDYADYLIAKTVVENFVSKAEHFIITSFCKLICLFIKTISPIIF